MVGISSRVGTDILMRVGMKSGQKCRSVVGGYSLVEMMMTLAVGLILVSVALPTMVGAVQAYRLNSISQQLAGLIDLTRYTAIRRNTVLTLQMKSVSDGTYFFVDLNGNGSPDANEPMLILPSDMQLASTQCPQPDSNIQGLAATQNFAGQVTFDYRGTINFAPGSQIKTYFLALGYSNQAQYGCRAVTVTPMGQTKVWRSPDNGTWMGM
jgi:prepilin-type N-terminal cleavage/methylation domain-containing protein